MFADADAVATAVADALVDAMVDAQAQRGVTDIVLTGGGIGVASLAAVRQAARASAVDWSRVNIWWGDERYLAPGDPERNETQARAALLDHVPLDPRRVHPMPAAGFPPSTTADDGARAYADQLTGKAPIGQEVPAFDVLMLGMGPEGHVASLFPDSPGVRAAGSVVAVHDSPKPPPTRISLTLPALRAARAVWIIAAGAAKAAAAAACVDPNADPVDIPAAGARGRQSTVLWLDEQAAERLD